jgi:hypothetical protein
MAPCILSREGGQRPGYLTVAGYEPAEVVAQSKEGLYLFDCGWDRPVLDLPCFAGIHTDAIFTDDVPEVLHFWGEESALLGIGIELIVPQ